MYTNNIPNKYIENTIQSYHSTSFTTRNSNK